MHLICRSLILYMDSRAKLLTLISSPVSTEENPRIPESVLDPNCLLILIKYMTADGPYFTLL